MQTLIAYHVVPQIKAQAMYAPATLAGLALVIAIGAAPSNASIGTSLVAAPYDSSAFTGVAMSRSSRGA
jgi:hypothetical protein